MVGVVRLGPVQPGLPIRDEVGYQIDDAGLRELLQRNRCAPVFQWPPRLGVERPQEVGG